VGRTEHKPSGSQLRLHQGAVPIIRGGFVAGAIGASGATAQQDEQAAAAAVAVAAIR
jgi:uncharacterized protein GlcG (DUF336 family)